MSGTSMDGIDAALVRISGPATQPRVRLVAFETMPYPDTVRQRLLAIAGGAETTAEEIDQFHTTLGAAFGEAAVRVCHRGHVKPERLFAVGSHGQTIHHSGRQANITRPFLNAMVKLLSKMTGSRRKRPSAQPTLAEFAEQFAKLSSKARTTLGVKGGEELFALNLSYYPEVMKTYQKGAPVEPDLWFSGRRCTLQLGEPALIAERTGAPVVADFRPADMAAGGQGAPLVPMVDYLLLRDARKGTVALNIGGIANFTVIPAAAKPEEIFGFDTGPGNMIIDGLVRHFTDGKKAYDSGGRWAAKGRVIEPLLDRMLRFPFFTQQPPKSAGREQFGQWFITHFFLRYHGDAALPLERPLTRPAPAGENAGGGPPSPQGRGMEVNWGGRVSPEDLLRTATELTARTIAGAIERFVLGKVAIHRLVISGGGAHNRLLVARLTKLLPRLRLQRSDEFGLGVDAKEAIAFAVLADRTMHGLPGNLPTVTGARRPVVLGKISRP
jgi:1,6-anhydro-N-acetylmuramate kinase